MKNTFSSKLFLALACSTLLVACSGDQRGMFSSALSSTGLVSKSQADSIVKAGEHVGKAATSLNEEEEYYLGRGVSATVLAKYRTYNNQQLTVYVNKIVGVVSGVSDRPETFGGYHALILDTDEINAVSAPGGFIFVTKGFLKVVPNEDALAAVLAHEVAHVVKGHGVKAISEANLSEALMLIGKESVESQAQGFEMMRQLTSTFGDSINDISRTILVKGYSRSQEYQADEYAAVLLKRSGYDPGGLAAMLKSLETASHGSVQGGWASTHPKPEDRIDELGSAAKAQTDNVGEAERTRRFQAAVGKLS